MYPVLFRVGDFVITSFGVMLAGAFLVGGYLASLEFRRRGHDPDYAWQLVIGAVVGGIVGAKLYYMLLNWPDLLRDPWGSLASRSGLVWYGGFIGGALGVAYLAWRRQMPLGVVTDCAAVALPAAYAVGRLGCFLVGDDYGRPTDHWIGVAFPRGAPPSTAGNLREQFGVAVDPSIPDSQVLAVHPTQLYEIAMSLIIFAYLWRVRREPRPSGSLFMLYLMLAGIERFLVEIFRAKDDRFFGPLTLAQTISLAILLSGLYGWWRLRQARAAPVT